MTIKAFKTLDCHSKVRVHYRVPAPVTLELLKQLQGYELLINEFSRFVAGAKDHFTLSRPTMRACGVIGELKVVATYAKTEEADEVAERRELEEGLIRAFGTAVEYLPNRGEVV